jgi:acyl transferase domain-containing protein
LYEGEIASAFAAGFITGAEAVAIAYYRGVAVLNCKVEGAMLAVGLGAEEVRPYLEGRPDVIIGCYNSPQSVTLSGGEHAIDEVRRLLVERGIFARKVNTSGNAYHSHLMKSAAKEFTRLFEGVYTEMVHSPTRKVTVPRVPLYSCITGELFEFDEIPFSHWRANLELPVLFDQVSRLLLVSQPVINYFVEIGPHSALAGPIRQITASLGFDQARLRYLPSLIRGQDGVDNMLHLAGTLFTLGNPVDLVRINAIEVTNRDVSKEIIYKSGKLLVDIPNYQWNYGGLLWKQKRWSRELYFRKHCHHDILGSREPGGSQNSYLWRNHLQIAFVPWLRDHKVTISNLFD